MNNENEKYLDDRPFMAMWKAWLASYGSVSVVAVLSLWLPRLWLPILTFVMCVGVYAMVRRNRESDSPHCYVLPYLTIYILGWTASIIAAIDIWHSPTIAAYTHVQPNGTIPCLGALVVFSIASVITFWGAIRKYKLNYCVDCRLRLGTPVERGFIGLLYSQEGLFQRRLMFGLTIAEAIVCWAYFLLFYSAESITRGDIYFFAIFPAAIFVLSGIYLGIRYGSLWFYYSRDVEGSDMRHGSSTTVRYIVICGGEILLHVPDIDTELMPLEERIDTPARCTISYRRRVTTDDALDWFMNLIRANDPNGIEVRLMYESKFDSSQCNMLHYFAFLDSKEIADNMTGNNQWFTIYQIQQLVNSGRCNNMLASELHRLHTIAMAWKTYDRNGRRLYKIKHYTPTFRVADIRKFDVDFNDSHWLYVSLNNEDKPFYRIRRLWRRYISGIND